MTELTERQERVLKAFADLMHDNGKPPTVRELMAELDIRSPNGVSAHVRALLKKGALRRVGERRSARSYVPTGVSRCPICSRPFEEA